MGNSSKQTSIWLGCPSPRRGQLHLVKSGLHGPVFFCLTGKSNCAPSLCRYLSHSPDSLRVCSQCRGPLFYQGPDKLLVDYCFQKPVPLRMGIGHPSHFYRSEHMLTESRLCFLLKGESAHNFGATAVVCFASFACLERI